jgi:hypothetical protein
MTHLRLALALDNQQRYAEALAEANKSAALAPADQPVAKLAQTEIDRLKKLSSTSAAPASSSSQPASAPATPR